MAMISLSTTKVAKLSVSSFILLAQPLCLKMNLFQIQEENQPKEHYDPFYYKGSSKIVSSLGPKSEEVLANQRLENGFSNSIPNSPKYQKVPKVIKSTKSKHFQTKINPKLIEQKNTRFAYGKFLIN